MSARDCQSKLGVQVGQILHKEVASVDVVQSIGACHSRGVRQERTQWSIRIYIILAEGKVPQTS